MSASFPPRSLLVIMLAAASAPAAPGCTIADPPTVLCPPMPDDSFAMGPASALDPCVAGRVVLERVAVNVADPNTGVPVHLLISVGSAARSLPRQLVFSQKRSD